LAVCVVIFIYAGTAQVDAVSSPALPGALSETKVENPASKQLVGTVVAFESADLVTTIDGVVQVVHVGLGDRVKKGDALVTMDMRRVRGDLDTAKAALEAAESAVAHSKVEFEQAVHELGSQRRLSSAGAGPREDATKAEFGKRIAGTGLRSSRAQRDQARIAMEQLKIKLAESVVRAPFDGVVTGRYTNRGQRVNTGTIVIKLLSSAPPWLRFAIPGERMDEFKIGTRIQASLEPGGKIASAVIERLAPDIDPQSGLVFAEARFSDGATLEDARPGSIAHILAATSGPGHPAANHSGHAVP
jgi:RND family efflux transporter MFP subunit